jgi:AraC-like DNA-binding protein
MVLVRMMRRLCGQDWLPSEASFQHDAPDDHSEHAALICPRLHFMSPATEIRFDAECLHRKVANSDRHLLPIVERQLADALQEGGDPDIWLREVELLIARRVCDGHPNLPSVADQLGLSVRSLQRRLEERGIAYRDLVAHVRTQLARRYLAKSSTPLIEIAFLLGYSELSAFDRAFRRWTGQTPMEYRRATKSSKKRKIGWRDGV